ncbi:MAG: hypothetical protein JWN76_1212 [Chitinophagaceae bacterium]|nr:hypothetical protein [Chitinophagaceae bacterium]
MKNFIFTFLTLLIAVSASTQNSDEQKIREILSTQTKAWNKGQIENFMVGYWQSDSLVFIGKNGPTYGYQKTLENYKKGYPDTSHMGQLKFTLLSLKKLSPEYYFVIGKWNLQRSVGDVGGSFTLLFRKIKGRWLIVSDHSS